MQTKSFTALSEFVATAFEPPAKLNFDQKEARNLETELKEVEVKIRQVQGFNPSMVLPYEVKALAAEAKAKEAELQETRTEILTRIGEISQEAEQQKVRYNMHLQVARKGYPQQLDTKPLAHGGVTGPTFLVSPFDNRSGKCEITVRIDSDQTNFGVYFKPKLPEAIEAMLQTATKKLARNMSDKYSKVTISASFAGYAADKAPEILEAVRTAKASGAFDQILVIAEVQKWSVDEVVRLKEDPVIVGWVNKTRQMFYITDYDMTPLEDYFKTQAGFGITIK